MLTESIVLPNRYLDSVFLMRVAKRLAGEPGIIQAAVVMATPKNLQVLADAGYAGVDELGASVNDLVVSLQAETREGAHAVLTLWRTGSSATLAQWGRQWCVRWTRH